MLDTAGTRQGRSFQQTLTYSGDAIMYTDKNYRTKKALKEAVKNGDQVTVYQPGPFGGNPPSTGRVALEGPHYPEPH